MKPASIFLFWFYLCLDLAVKSYTLRSISLNFLKTIFGYWQWELNSKIQQLLPGDLCHTNLLMLFATTGSEVVNYPIEFLNTTEVWISGYFTSYLTPPWLSNSTILVIKKLIKNIIEATILNSRFRGKYVLLPRIPMTLTDVPLEFKRAHFSVGLVFALTTSNSQGCLFVVQIWICFYIMCYYCLYIMCLPEEFTYVYYFLIDLMQIL